MDAAPGTTAAPLPGTDTGGEPHAGSPEDSASRSLHTDVEQPPIRSLAGLLWPPDPEEEGLNALNDPLNRDEPKPLLHSELLAIGESKASDGCHPLLTALANASLPGEDLIAATSVRLRQLLSTHPFLKDVLNKISRIPNYPPKFPQTVRIKQILGLGEDEGVPNALYYRPIEESGKKASQNQQHDRRNEHSMGLTAGRTFVAEHEREALREFNEVVKAILGEERRKRNSGQAN